MLQRPRRLRPGDRIASVTPSWGGPGTFPHRYAAGVRQLEQAFGVEVVQMPHTDAQADLLAARPDLRVADLHRAFSDPSIAGVVSTIGGDDAIRLLPLLDLDLLAAHPKPFLGYSDTTILHMALRRAGVTSFYGPAIMAGFGENAGLDDYLIDGVRRMLFESWQRTRWPENGGGWTVEMLDWGDPASQDRRRERRPATGWRWHGGGTATGPTTVGCLEVLDWLRGSAWWPELEGAVLLLETSEEQPPPQALARFLRVLALTGELGALAAIVVGRPGGAELDPLDHEAYDRALLDVVRREAGLDDLAVVTGVDFGHTDPMWTVPQGVALEVDTDARTLTFVEPATR